MEVGAEQPVSSFSSRGTSPHRSRASSPLDLDKKTTKSREEDYFI